MVAVEDEDGPSAGPGLDGEGIEEIQDLGLVIAPIEDVSGLDQDQSASGPVPVGVHGSGKAQRLARRADVPVEVTILRTRG